EGAERSPLAEDQRRERDEAAPGGHVLREGVHEADREEDAAHRGEGSGSDDGGIAGAVDRDPDRIGRPRMLTHRANAQADRRAEQEEPGDNQYGEAEPDHQVEVAEHVLEEVAESLRRNRREEPEM